MATRTGSELSDYEIRLEGWRALTERLGLSGAVRFLLQYDPGHGDYVKERQELLRDLTMDEALRRVRDAEAPDKGRSTGSG